MLKETENCLHMRSIHKRPKSHAKDEMLKYHAGAPMKRMHLGFLGPLSWTARRIDFVLVMVDEFTKWVECILLPS